MFLFFLSCTSSFFFLFILHLYLFKLRRLSFLVIFLNFSCWVLLITLLFCLMCSIVITSLGKKDTVALVFVCLLCNSLTSYSLCTLGFFGRVWSVTVAVHELPYQCSVLKQLMQILRKCHKLWKIIMSQPRLKHMLYFLQKTVNSFDRDEVRMKLIIILFLCFFPVVGIQIQLQDISGYLKHLS